MRGKRKKDRGEGGGRTQSSSSEKCFMAMIMANSLGNGFNNMDYGCGRVESSDCIQYSNDSLSESFSSLVLDCITPTVMACVSICT